MGAGQSKTEEKPYYSEVPIQFSQDVINHLADSQVNTDTSPARQSTIDEHVRARINSELERLRREEEDVREAIQQALEKENLDKERKIGEDDGAETKEGEEESEVGKVKSSVSLMEDLEELKQKVDRYHAKRSLDDFPEVKTSGEAVVACYKNNPTTVLNCWKEIDRFKASVAELEQDFVKSLR